MKYRTNLKKAIYLRNIIRDKVVSKDCNKKCASIVNVMTPNGIMIAKITDRQSSIDYAISICFEI